MEIGIVLWLAFVKVALLAAPESFAVRNPKNGALILVVEDEWLILDMLRDALEGAGYSVVATSSGEGAFRSLDKRDFSLIITDVNLAGEINGWEVANRGRELSPSVPVIYTTAYPPDRSRAVDQSEFVSKPYAPSHILTLARSMVGEAQHRGFDATSK